MSAQDRQRKRGVETHVPGGRRARKVAVNDDVGDPLGPAARPDTPGQPGPAGEHGRTAQLDELGKSWRRVGPRRHESKRIAAAFEFPERAVFPAQWITHRRQRLRRRRGERRRLGDGVSDVLHDSPVRRAAVPGGVRSWLFHTYSADPPPLTALHYCHRLASDCALHQNSGRLTGERHRLIRAVRADRR